MKDQKKLLLDIFFKCFGTLYDLFSICLVNIGEEKRISNIVIIISVVLGTLLLGIAIWLLWSFKNKLIGMLLFFC